MYYLKNNDQLNEKPYLQSALNKNGQSMTPTERFTVNPTISSILSS